MAGGAPHAIGMVAHDARKAAMVTWASTRLDTIGRCKIFATGTTGKHLLAALPSLDVTRLKSGPLGGDLQLGAMVAEGRLDALIFFVDPLAPLPHDVDVKALIRIGTLADILLACNQRTADAVLDALNLHSSE